MRPLMVLGCTSTAGKSLLVTALARWFARKGVDVVPFKAQNMSNNARVVDGPLDRSGQWPRPGPRIEPVTDRNPVLLKTESDTAKVVVREGKPTPGFHGATGPHLWPAMAGAFDGAGRHEWSCSRGR